MPWPLGPVFRCWPNYGIKPDPTPAASPTTPVVHHARRGVGHGHHRHFYGLGHHRPMGRHVLVYLGLSCAVVPPAAAGLAKAFGYPLWGGAPTPAVILGGPGIAVGTGPGVVGLSPVFTGVPPIIIGEMPINVPEPSSLALLATGILLLAYFLHLARKFPRK